MALKVLSPFSYYGGKARMSPLICDMLDYENTDIFIEPFGGAARPLLNKPQHEIEIYNDLSAGLCAFMRVMSNKDTANELISRLYKTEYSPEEFYHAMQIRNEVEDRYIDELKRQAFLYIKQLILKYDSDDLELLKENIQRKKILEIAKKYHKVKHSNLLEDEEKSILCVFNNQFYNYMRIYKKILKQAYEEQLIVNFNEFKQESIKKVNEEISSCSDKLKTLSENKEKDVSALNEKIKKLNEILLKIYDMSFINIDSKSNEKLIELSYEQAYEIAYNETANNHDDIDIDIDDIDLAEATYIVYSQSRDGMGKDWSKSKYKSTNDYHNQINRLYDVAERLEGIQVYQIDAMDFFRHYFESEEQYKDLSGSVEEEDIEYGFYLMNKWISNPRVMMCCDPSYIDPEDERRILEKREKEKKEEGEQAQEEQTKTKKVRSPKNLGTAYKASFDYEAQEYFVKAICDAKCKMIVCNYDLELYNKYLTADKNWSRIEFETKTSVGGIKDNKRVEVLWYNY